MLPVADSDPILVSNGFDESIAHMETEFNFKAKKDGKIKKIDGNYVVLEYEDGDTETIPLESIEKNSAKSIYVPNNTVLMPGLEEGSKIKEGDIVTYNEDFYQTDGETLHFTPGPIVNVALHSAPETYEDSTMVSEKLTDRLGAKVVKRYVIKLDKDAKIHEAKTSFDGVKSGEPLMVFESMLGDEELDEFLNIESSDLNKLEKKVKRGGTITDIKVYRTSNLDEYSSSLQYYLKKIDDYMMENEDIKGNILEEEGSQENKMLYSKKHTKIKSGEKVNGVKLEKEEMMFEYYVETYDSFSKGDKNTNHSALKAINARVLLEEEMPIGNETGRQVDVFLSPYSPYKRMTNSVFIAGYLNAALLELQDQCKEILGITE